MDDNTVEVLRTLIAAVFGLIGFGVLVWGMVKATTSGALDASVEVSHEPIFVYHVEWGDDDEWDDEDDSEGDAEQEAARWN